MRGIMPHMSEAISGVRPNMLLKRLLDIETDPWYFLIICLPQYANVADDILAQTILYWYNSIYTMYVQIKLLLLRIIARTLCFNLKFISISNLTSWQNLTDCTISNDKIALIAIISDTITIIKIVDKIAENSTAYF